MLVSTDAWLALSVMHMFVFVFLYTYMCATMLVCACAYVFKTLRIYLCMYFHLYTGIYMCAFKHACMFGRFVIVQADIVASCICDLLLKGLQNNTCFKPWFVHAHVHKAVAMIQLGIFIIFFVFLMSSSWKVDMNIENTVLLK